jgi:hypothetical protein
MKETDTDRLAFAMRQMEKAHDIIKSGRTDAGLYVIRNCMTTINNSYKGPKPFGGKKLWPKHKQENTDEWDDEPA